MKLVWIALAGLVIQSTSLAAVVQTQDRQVTIRTQRLEATLKSGAIVKLIDLQTGEPHSIGSESDLVAIRGLGHLGSNPRVAANLHNPWGTYRFAFGGIPNEKSSSMHRPATESAIDVESIPNGARVTWTGLTDGKVIYPNEQLVVAIWEDPTSGALLYRASARSPTGGVYGVQVPLVNLHSDHAFFVPSFGGTMYDRNMDPALITLGGSPYLEAPVIGIEGAKGSIGIWTEDAEFHSNFFFLTWDGKRFSVALEHLNLFPFEFRKDVHSVTWRLDVFEGGWVDAMTPYKEWYGRTFSKEIEAKGSVTWADRIRVVIDQWERDRPEVLSELASLLGSANVLFHFWDARASAFDRDLPDWTPREGYVERVRALQKLGFRTMAYVNSYCVNYESPVFQRDKIRNFGLTRRIKRFFTFLDEPQSFDRARPGEILYLDPLSSQWRKYHTDMMIDWRNKTGTDANYEDTGGSVGDFGNGVVDGKFGAQGSAELFRELLIRNQRVPMATEFGPAPIAFASRWPLRYQQVWGSDDVKQFWMENLRPVSSYIHGPNHIAWTPTLNAESSFLRFLVAASSDALGGVAQMPGTRAALQAKEGILAHLKYRAELFARKQLTPYFVRSRQERNAVSMYRDSAGGIYRYYADSKIQKMVGPDGKEIYARVTGVRSFDTRLSMRGWPAMANGVAFGLNPRSRYVFKAGGEKDTSTIRILEMPDDAHVSRCYETPTHVVLVLERPPAAGSGSARVQLELLSDYDSIVANDRPVPWSGKKGTTINLEIQFPAHLLFARQATGRVDSGVYAGDGRKEVGRYIMVDSGLDRGGEYIPGTHATIPVPGEKRDVPFQLVSFGDESEIVLDYLFLVPDSETSVRVYQINRSEKFGNASIGRMYINGRLRHSYDFDATAVSGNSSSRDTDIHSWTIPLGAMAGQTVLVSIGSDGKASNNADSHWWSRPMLVRDAKQREVYLRFVNSEPTAEK